jgi:hypothetical protein
MENPFALLYWPAAGAILLWLLPHKREADHAWQGNLALFVWLFVALSIPDFIQQAWHPTNGILRCSAGHSTAGKTDADIYC